MKFIRDIIAERSDTKKSEPTPSPAALTPEPAQKEKARRPDRTMTRLSDGAMFEGDDVFKRLMGETTEEAGNVSDLLDPQQTSDEEEDMRLAFEEVDKLLDDFAEDTQEIETDAEDGAYSDEETEFGAFDETEKDDLSDMLWDDEPDAEPQSTDEPMDLDTSSNGFDEAFQSESELSTSKANAPGTPDTRDTDEIADMIAVPAPASGRSGRGAGRVKTRLLGFGPTDAPVHDPFAATAAEHVSGAQTTFPVGWLVVTAGPGRGTSFSLQNGVSQIGRGEDQAVRLDFGDTSISRTNHAAIAYDAEQGGFFLGHGGKANMVRLNDRPVLATEEISSGAMIRIGETTLRFVALCDGDFSWTEEGL